MIVDSSVIVAIVNAEEDASELSDALSAAVSPKLSAANYLEIGITVDRKKRPDASRLVDTLISHYGVTIVPVTEKLAREARAAFNRYGKGMGHKAQLNIGDCFVYALAKETNEPLLFKGGDFTHTDVIPAIVR